MINKPPPVQKNMSRKKINKSGCGVKKVKPADEPDYGLRLFNNFFPDDFLIHFLQTKKVLEQILLVLRTRIYSE